MGQLIDLDSGMLWDDPKLLYPPGTLLRVFDRRERKWKTMMIDEIPNTCTLSQRPRNQNEEMDLWIRAFGRINHKFIWTESIEAVGLKRDNAAILLSRSARDSHNRYNVVDF